MAQDLPIRTGNRLRERQMEEARVELREAGRHLLRASSLLGHTDTEDIARITVENMATIVENIRVRVGRSQREVS